MYYLLPAAVFLLMASVGLSLKPTEIVANWRRVEWSGWLHLTLATFIIPPALALLLARLFHLSLPETAGLYMVGAAPGAPLLTRNVGRQGFDPHRAASYQVWAALMAPLMIPIVTVLAGKLYGRDIWISPALLLKQIMLKQFIPLAIGMIIAWRAPGRAERIQPAVNMLGNLLFFGLLAFILYKIGPALKLVTPLVPLAAVLLAVGSIATILMLPIRNEQVKATFAICNANRHAGLALLLSTQYFRAKGSTLPIIACYALIAPVVMLLYARYSRPAKERQLKAA